MRYVHAVASLLVVLAVLLACKRKETASTSSSTPTVDTATAAATDTASAAPTDTTTAATTTPSAVVAPTVAVAATHAALAATHAPSAKASASAASPASSAVATAGAFKNGDKVDVQWNGDWWKANVIAVNPGPTYKVHYEGWGNEWDESVAPARIRARTAGSRSK